MNKQREQEAQSDRDLAIKKAAFDAEVNRARPRPSTAISSRPAGSNDCSRAHAAGCGQAQVSWRSQTRKSSASRLSAKEISMAELLAEKNRAEAVRKGEADSARIKMLGDADVAAKRSVGEAEATVLRKKADAWKEYGDAALVQMIVDKLPELAKNMTAPLSQTKEMVFVSSDGKGPSQLTNDVGRMLSQLPATVKGLTGLDIRDVMNGKKKFANEKPEATEASM